MKFKDKFDTFMINDDLSSAIDKLNEIITCSVIHIKDNGVKVKLNNNLDGFIEKENLSIDESEQNPRRYAANEKLDAMIKKVDEENKIVVLFQF